MHWRVRRRDALFAGAAAVLALLPILGAPRYLISVLTEVYLYAIFAMSLDLLVGFTGLASLGHAAFWGLGAYAAGIAAIRLTSNVLLTVPIGILVAGLGALLVGALSVRTSGVYFLMLTLAFAQIVYAIAFKWTWLTGGSNGLTGIPAPTMPLINLAEPGPVYIVALLALVASLGVLWRMVEAPLGRTFIGIRENEVRMRSLGYNTFRFKLAAFVIAGLLAGFAGALYAVGYSRAVSPADVHWTQSGLVMIMVIIGGVGTLIGPILGAAFELLLRNWVSSLPVVGERWMLFMGLVFGAFVLFARGGIVGLLKLRVAPEPATDVTLLADGEVKLRKVTLRPAGLRKVTLPPAGTPVLEVRGVGRRFGALQALRDVSLAITAGERLAIIGPNGAGKTTLFNVIAGDLAPTQGHVWLAGRDVTRLPAHARTALGIGRTYQRTNLFLGLSAVENVELAVRRRDGVAARPFRRATDYHEVRRESLTFLERIGLSGRSIPVRALSYGEQRQLEVAVALAAGPSVLLLDEPTAGMSLAETAAMLELVRGLPRDISVLIIEHDMDVIFALADRITVLHHGEVLADGEPTTIRADSSVQQAYLGKLRTH
jgi:ABC-type branched-subunit amino acid transport system ATPase component/ABC-type branched-subunit amino acid transport system permease subunit